MLQRVLDKGIVIDAWGRMSVASLDLFTVEARIVVASIETYLKRADAVRTIPWGIGSAPERTVHGPMQEPTDPGWELSASEAAVRAAEHYLENLREGRQSEGA